MLQYKIPQNIGIEDKIVGPFSLRQLIILAVGGGISYVIFAISSKLYELNTLEYIVMALPALFALAAAMLKVHNVTFTKYIMLMLEFAIKPKKRMWDHRGISALVAPDLTEKQSIDKEKSKMAEKSRKNVNLSHLSAMLDSGGFEHVEQVKHEDIDKVDDDDLITEAYFGHKKKESSTGNMYWRTREVQKKKLDLLAKIQTPVMTPPVPQTAPAKPAEPIPVAVSIPPPTPLAPITPPATPPTPTVQPVTATEKPKEEKKESVAEHLAKVIKEARQNNEVKKTVATPTIAAPPIAIPKKKRKRKKKPKNLPQPVRQNTPVNTISKTEPAKEVQKPEIPAKKPDKTEKETSFSDLSGGDEIEINLD